VQADAAAELVALQVYKVRRQRGRATTSIDIDLVRDVFTELAGHSPQCNCGACEAACYTDPERVLATALHWPRDPRRSTRVPDDGLTAEDPPPPRSYCVGGCGRTILDADDPEAWLVTEMTSGYMRVRCPTCQGDT
jgi:hypothetical protein